MHPVRHPDLVVLLEDVFRIRLVLTILRFATWTRPRRRGRAEVPECMHSSVSESDDGSDDGAGAEQINATQTKMTAFPSMTLAYGYDLERIRKQTLWVSGRSHGACVCFACISRPTAPADK